MVHIVKLIFVGWLELNLVTESASVSVDGRVRSHDEKESFVQTASLS